MPSRASFVPYEYSYSVEVVAFVVVVVVVVVVHCEDIQNSLIEDHTLLQFLQMYPQGKV